MAGCTEAAPTSRKERPMSDAQELIARLEAATGPDRDLDGLPDRIARRIAIDGATGCWNWTSPNSLVGRGRGYVSINGKPMLHHRAVWTLLVGAIPKGAYLCHHCDNPRCCNPDHLYVGDSKTNVADMVSRGRHWTRSDLVRAREVGRVTGSQNDWARGMANPKAKLADEQVAAIRASTVGSRALAQQYGVHRTTIQRIRSGTAWN
jgi:hypothetical protein